MKTFTIFCTLFFAFLGDPSVFGQQLPLLTYYREHHSLINPGTLYYENYASGSTSNQSFGASYRQQWLGIHDAPRTSSVRFEHVLPERNILYGAVLMRDDIGLTDLTGGYLRFAYQARSSEDPNSTFFSIGMNVGFFQYRFQPWKGKTRDPNDLTAETRNQQGILDAALGVFFSKKLFQDDILYLGASVPQLVSTNFTKDISTAIQRYRHYYLLVGYYHFFGEKGSAVSSSFIEPSIWLRYVPYIPLQIDANVRVNIDQFWIGGGLAMSPVKGVSFDLIHAEAGFRLPLGGSNNLLKIGYGLDVTTNNASTRLGPTHEINLVFSRTK
jgi:type IX secretion system PorP/SprF family membrane protein